MKKDTADHSLQQIRAIIQEKLKQLSGIEDVSGVEIARLIHSIANYYENVVVAPDADLSLSSQRWGILLRLMIEENLGNSQGITPSRLSMFQNVQKNTISSLLNGLEEQGLIERCVDKEDRRFSRIHLSPLGREITTRITPKHMVQLNKLGSGLRDSEKEQLIRLLGKLFRSLIVNGAADPS